VSSLVLEPGRAVGEKTRRVGLGRHVRQYRLDRLEGADRLAELLALASVLDRVTQRAGRDPDRERGDRDPAAVEHLHRLLEAGADLADLLPLRDPTVLQHDLRGVGGPHAQLVLVLADRESGRPLLDDEGRDPVVRLGRVGRGEQDRRPGRRRRGW